MKKFLQYYVGTSYHRKMLDELLEKSKGFFSGTVLDIGGRKRGEFDKPRNAVEKWIFADIEKEHNPDIVLNVSDMSQIETNSIDVVLATELFEHVKSPEKGLSECYRVLKPGGLLITSMPFLFRIHADPYDFQRWTEHKWRLELEKLGFSIVQFEAVGRFFAAAMDMCKVFVRYVIFRPLRWFFYLLYPLMDLIVKLDRTHFVQKTVLVDYPTGYFIIVRK